MTTTSTPAATGLDTLRDAQMILTAAIAHAREESLEPAWKDQLLGLRLRLERRMVKMIEQDLEQLDRVVSGSGR
jgi:hypothetical protein